MAEVWTILKGIRAEGEAWECGVYRGETAVHLAAIAKRQGRILRLFDTFQGRPEKGPMDTGVSQSAFTDTSLERAQAAVGMYPVWHPGLIPQTFDGLDASRIAFAYVDLDLYQSTVDALTFIAPRLVEGGVIVVDDYDAAVQWPGVRLAVDSFPYPQQRDGTRVLLRTR